MSKISPSEALYGFAGWLTTRQPPVTMSSTHDAGVVARLLSAFCKSQSLEDPRDDFMSRMAPYPEGGDNDAE